MRFEIPGSYPDPSAATRPTACCDRDQDGDLALLALVAIGNRVAGRADLDWLYLPMRVCASLSEL